MIQKIRSLMPFAMSLVCMFFLTLATAHAQVTTADIVGNVTDPSGAAVVTGTATATNVGTNVTQKMALGGEGSFTFTQLQVGTYKVTVTAAGFKGYATMVTVAAGDRARINAQLSMGQAEQTVTVEATTPALKTDDSTIGTLITSEATQDLPLNGRNVTSLVTLAAGVTSGLGNAMNSGTRPDDRRMSSSFAANGQSDEINNNMIDGMDNNERFIGSVGVRPSIDAVEEVKVLTNLYTAEVSRSGGGVVDLITKSGTNNFHGTAYEFLRNDKFDAKDRFATIGPKPELRQNQFGGSVGGPIKKDKAFFFFDYENFRLIKGVTAVSTVPTAYEEQNPGDFTDLGEGCTNLTTQEGWTPGKIGLNYLKLYPAPNISSATPSGVGCTPPINNYNFTGGSTQFIKTYDAKADYRFSPRDSMYARYTYNDTNVFIPSTFPEVGGINPGAGVWGAAGGSSFAGPAADVEHSAALDYNRLLSNNVILDLKAQYMRLNNNSGPVNQGKDVSTTFGFPCTATSCVNLPNDNPSSGLMALSFNADNYSPLGDAAYVPLLDQNNTFQYVGSLSWLKGPHSIKLGAGVIRRQVSEGQSPFPRGFMQDNGDLTGNPIGDMLSDYSTQVQRSNTLVIADFRSWEMGYYAQDDYRLKPNLTLNLGVRFDVYTPFTSTNYGFTNFNPDLGLLFGPGLPGPQQSNSTAGVKTDWSDLAPRLGFAYTAKPGLVVRGGFGITFFPENTASGSFMRNAPYSFSYSCGSTAYTTAGVCGDYSWGGSGATAGGYYMDSGLPVPQLNMDLATNPANYIGTTIQQTDFGYKNAYLQQYSLNVEKDLHGNVVTVAYVGNHGGRLVTDSINSNQLPIPVADGGSYPYPQFPGVNIAARKSVLKSLYNAGQVSVERRMHEGLAANVNYTWAHSLTNAEDIDEGQATGNCFGVCHMDDGTGKAVDVNSFYQYDYGNADIDTRQRLALTMSYDLPFGKSLTGPAAYVVKGWSTNAIYYAQSGNPFNIQNPNGTTSGIGLGNDRPNQVLAPMAHSSGFKRSLNSWWDPATLAVQGAGLLGNEKRNQYYGPGTQALGLSVFKQFPIWEQLNLQFRTEMFNLLNTPTYGNPSNTFNNSFGSINGTPAAATPRQIQFALKLIF